MYHSLIRRNTKAFITIIYRLSFLVVAETDAPETEVPETDGAETDVPETEEGGDGGRPRQMSPRRKVCCCSFATLWKA